MKAGECSGLIVKYQSSFNRLPMPFRVLLTEVSECVIGSGLRGKVTADVRGAVALYYMDLPVPALISPSMFTDEFILSFGECTPWHIHINPSHIGYPVGVHNPFFKKFRANDPRLIPYYREAVRDGWNSFILPFMMGRLKIASYYNGDKWVSSKVIRDNHQAHHNGPYTQCTITDVHGVSVQSPIVNKECHAASS